MYRKISYVFILVVVALATAVDPDTSKDVPQELLSKTIQYLKRAIHEDNEEKQEPIERSSANIAEYDDGYEYPEDAAPFEGDDTYAREFPYGLPIGKFNVEERMSRATPRRGRAQVRIVHKWSGKPYMYAKKYRTWMPGPEWIKPVQKKRPIMKGPPREKMQEHRRYGPPRRRKVKPPRSNNLQRPIPPRDLDYDYGTDEEYFPEETKRNEYDYRERHPSSTKGPRRKPIKHKLEKHIPKDEYDSVSYSNFVQHPGSSSSSSSFDYTDVFEDEPPRAKDRRKKKKRKGDRKRIRDHEEDQFGAHSESSEESTAGGYSERYPPYYDENIPHRRPIRHPSPTPATPIYGDGYIGNQIQGTKLPQIINNKGYNDVGGLGRYRNEMSSGAAQTFNNLNYEPTGFNNFGVSNINPPPTSDIITQQNFHQFQNPPFNQGQHFNDVQISPPNYNAINNLNQQVANNYNRQIPYNQNFRPTMQPNAHTYQNIPTTTHEYSSRYKSDSFFDNTESFNDFNQNINYQQQQQDKHFGAKQGRPNNFVPSTQYELPGDPDNEFINRHLDLYSNGMSGVPIQGDGFGGDRRQEHRTKDYDIGYGEIQYDENHGQKK